MIRTILILLFFLLQTNKAFSLIEVDITRWNLDPLPIAVSPLHVDPNSKTSSNIKVKELGEKISEIVEKNFKSTGLFNPLKNDRKALY